MFVAQERLIFLPQAAAVAARPPPGWSLETVSFTAPDGTALGGVLVKPPGPPAPLVIYYGGNAEVVAASAEDAFRRWGPRAVLLMDYRGYGVSAGRPGEAALVDDALVLFDAAARRRDVDGSAIALHGTSLGSGVAVRVAAARPVRAVILGTPFDSLRAVAASAYPWLPVGLLLRHPFDSLARAPGIRAPALFLVAGADEVIAPAHARRLAAAWGGPAETVEIAGAGHNDLLADPRSVRALGEFLDSHLPAARAAPLTDIARHPRQP